MPTIRPWGPVIDETPQAQLGFAFDKTSDYVVKVFGWVLLILLLSAVYEWLLSLPACPPGYVRVRY